MVVWHYTVGEKLPLILVDGSIAVAVVGVPDGERPAVWFTKRATWEPTASKGILDKGSKVTRSATIEEMTRDRGGPLVRIGVEEASVRWSTWVQHRESGGIPRADASRLVKIAVAAGSNPGDWLVSYDAIPRSLWVAVERSVDGEEWTDEVEINWKGDE